MTILAVLVSWAFLGGILFVAIGGKLNPKKPIRLYLVVAACGPLVWLGVLLMIRKFWHLVRK